jgi:D-3-phosphoglycerate dehydrogenase
MKIVCVGDVYVDSQMMLEGVTPYLTSEDRVENFFFGETSRGDMRDTVKAIEAMKRDIIPVPNGLFDAVYDCDLLIVHLCPVTARLIENAPNLKAILSCRGGTENIDVEAATKHGVIVSTNPAHNANAVAEYTIGLIICETRNISRANASLREGVWRESFPNTATTIRELCDMTVGIIGFGSVGRLVAEKLSVFNCNILIYDPYISESAYDFINFKFVDLDTLLGQADVITLHARSSTPIIGADELDKMKKTVYLINTARSVLVDPTALKQALDEHKIMGAAIDVFESEPVIPEFYKNYDNITITNHRGGDTINSYKDAPSFAIKNYLNYCDGGRLRFWVNKAGLNGKF